MASNRTVSEPSSSTSAVLLTALGSHAAATTTPPLGNEFKDKVSPAPVRYSKWEDSVHLALNTSRANTIYISCSLNATPTRFSIVIGLEHETTQTLEDHYSVLAEEKHAGDISKIIPPLPDMKIVNEQTIENFKKWIISAIVPEQLTPIPSELAKLKKQVEITNLNDHAIHFLQAISKTPPTEVSIRYDGGFDKKFNVNVKYDASSSSSLTPVTEGSGESKDNHSVHPSNRLTPL